MQPEYNFANNKHKYSASEVLPYMKYVMLMSKPNLDFCINSDKIQNLSFGAKC